MGANKKQLLAHLRKSKSFYTDFDEIFIIIRIFIDGLKMNISTGIKIQFKDWIENWLKTQKKNPISLREENHQKKNLLLKSKLKRGFLSWFKLLP